MEHPDAMRGLTYESGATYPTSGHMGSKSRIDDWLATLEPPPPSGTPTQGAHGNPREQGLGEEHANKRGQHETPKETHDRRRKEGSERCA
eukprot:9490512-Pyramimonas_sp.AAC.2